MELTNRQLLTDWLINEATTSNGESLEKLASKYEFKRVVFIDAWELAKWDSYELNFHDLNDQEPEELEEELQRWDSAAHREYTVRTDHMHDTHTLVLVVIERFAK